MPTTGSTPLSYLIPIRRETVRRNPAFGDPIVFYGRTTTTLEADGSITTTRPVIPIRTMGQPGWAVDTQEWLYSYDKTVLVSCCECQEVFSWTTLDDTTDYDYDGTAIGYDRVCPHCREPDCCTLDFEALSAVLTELQLPKKETTT
jgi:hypothetical protein